MAGLDGDLGQVNHGTGRHQPKARTGVREVQVRRWQGLDAVPADWDRSAVTIGVFDGVHRGHRAVVERLVAAARPAGLAPVVVTFDPHPMEVVRPGSHPELLSTLQHRLDLLAELRVAATLVLPFTTEFSQLSAEEFVRLVLVDAVHAGLVVVGNNFRFGHKAAGTVAQLGLLGSDFGFEVLGLDLVPSAGGTQPVSSTAIRAAVAAGDMPTATAGLGRSHRVEGTVVEGDRRGRDLGYPTANLSPTEHAAIPADGVYAGWLVVSGVPLPAAISIGTNPTFDGTERRVEAYALDRDDLDLYGQHVAIDFAERLRETVRFDSVEALLAQMSADVAQTRQRVGEPSAPR
jgi:riboflavin kinase / FMN adenylyltransferase